MQKHYLVTLRSVLALLVMSLLPTMLHAQGQGTPGNRANNPFSVQLQRAWELRLNERVKLVEIGPVGGDKNNRLVLLVEGKNKDDYKRKLLVFKWNGLQFDTEYTSPEFLGTSLDSLLVGAFRENKPGPKPAKDKPAVKLPAYQIITTKSVYAHIGGSFTRLFDAPADVRAALMLDKTPAQIISGQGDSAAPYQMNETGVLPSAIEPPADGPGYMRFGVGTHDIPLFFRGSVRYIQSHWNNKTRWLIGLQPGLPANWPDAPSHATVSDRLIVFAPRLASREKSFWNTSPEDLEEVWRSEPLPGRVLDVRVGDPKNDGQEGILVLTSENNDQNRRLHFFAITSGVRLP
jgi:hypothetical protein